MLHVIPSLTQQQVSTSSQLTSNVCGLIARCSTRIHNMPGGLWCQGMSRQAACFALQQHTYPAWTKLVQTDGYSVTQMWSWDCRLGRPLNWRHINTTWQEARPEGLGCHWPRVDGHVNQFQLGTAANLAAAGLPLPADPAAQTNFTNLPTLMAQLDATKML